MSFGCEYCKADSEGFTTCFHDKRGRHCKLYIPEGEAAIVYPGTYDYKYYIPIKYCPFCGRSLTDKLYRVLFDDNHMFFSDKEK